MSQLMKYWSGESKKLDSSALVQRCYEVMMEVHKHDKRNCGGPYHKHPQRVGDSLKGNDFEQALGYIHDVVEMHKEYEGWSILGLLERCGISRELIYAAQAMDKPDTMPYAEHIEALARYDKRVLRVKLADMLDNLCDEPTERQRGKYSSAVHIIVQGLR